MEQLNVRASRTWWACSTHAYVEMNFPSGSSGVEDEQVECIVANVFLRRPIIDLHSLNLELIALVADVFF